MQQAVTSTTTTTYTPGVAWTNMPIVSTPAATTGLLPAGPACQPCPACGGLQCLCRPRFFAGQLLTEQDLNRLEQYIIAKNQLHNRYLVGQGVVCGLEVKCSPCANTLTVSSGYAIDTCGSDIIVCSPDTVDICALIKACTPTNQVNCAPYKDNSYCQDMEQEWILAIRYQETPSRGITPLTGSSQCSCGGSSSGSCSCGASATKTCGCGSMLPAGSCCGQTMSTTSMVSNNLPRRGAPPTCEPTVTCEAYRYEVFLAPMPTSTVAPAPVRGLAGLASTIGGDLFARLYCCVQGLLASLPPMPTTTPQQDPVGWSNYCCNLRQALIQYVSMQGGTDCQALAKLRAVSCPSPKRDSDIFVRELGRAFEEELLIVVEILIGCFCSAALPPCPPPGDPRVPLASVRIRASDCTILSVCDWTPLRKNVVTTKTLGYWLGWLPYVPMIRKFMQEVCCGLFGLRDQLGYYPAKADVAEAQTRDLKADTNVVGAAPEQTTETEDVSEALTFGARTYYASNPMSEAVVGNLAAGPQSLSVTDLANALFTPINPGASGATDNAQTLAATPHAKVLAEIARPLMTSFGPLISAAMGSLPAQSDDTASAMTAMRAELDSLKNIVTLQQNALNALQPQTKQS